MRTTFPNEKKAMAEKGQFSSLILFPIFSPSRMKLVE
jgi:hypothetical protein